MVFKNTQFQTNYIENSKPFFESEATKMTARVGTEYWCPVGFEEDGITPKFEKHIFEEDETITVSSSSSSPRYNAMIYAYNLDIYNKNTGVTRTTKYLTFETNTSENRPIYAGDTAPDSDKYELWYDTTENRIKLYSSSSGWYYESETSSSIITQKNITSYGVFLQKYKLL